MILGWAQVPFIKGTVLVVSQPPVLLDEIADVLASGPTPQGIIAFKPAEALQQRALEHLQRKREDHLTAAERHEMVEFMRMDHFMTVLRARARLNPG
jgi:hypothetical protein